MPTPIHWPLASPSSPVATTPANAFGAASYLRTLKQLLPPSVLFTTPGPVLSKTLQAISDELGRVDARAIDLLNEADPRTATETLEDWERTVSLPDAQIPSIPATTAGRRVAVTQKWVARGGQSRAYFTALVSACGWTLVSLDVAAVLRANCRANDRCYDSTYAYSINFNLTGAVTGALATADLERVLRHATHAHIITQFTYV